MLRRVRAYARIFHISFFPYALLAPTCEGTELNLRYDDPRLGRGADQRERTDSVWTADALVREAGEELFAMYNLCVVLRRNSWQPLIHGGRGGGGSYPVRTARRGACVVC